MTCCRFKSICNRISISLHPLQMSRTLAAHRKALLRTVADVMSGRVKSQ
jgi:hypothetical protein